MTARTCPDCHTPLRPYNTKRGHCNACYSRHHRRGTHIDAPTQYRPAADTIDTWRVLHARGYNRADAAAHMGISKAALDRVLWRNSRAARLAGSGSPATTERSRP